jgi:hypothetical protein
MREEGIWMDAGTPRTKSGKGPRKNKAPTSIALELWAGYIMIPAPGMESAFQAATAMVWVSYRILDNERKLL